MKNIYCTICAKDQDHKFSVDGNGEFLAVCEECGHFLKFPSDYKLKDINNAVKEHKEANVDQVSLAEQEKVLEELNANTMAKEDAKV